MYSGFYGLGEFKFSTLIFKGVERVAMATRLVASAHSADRCNI